MVAPKEARQRIANVCAKNATVLMRVPKYSSTCIVNFPRYLYLHVSFDRWLHAIGPPCNEIKHQPPWRLLGAFSDSLMSVSPPILGVDVSVYI